MKNLYYTSGTSTLFATGNFTNTSDALSLSIGDLSCNFVATLNTTTRVISAIQSTNYTQNGFQYTTTPSSGTGNAILYLSPNIYFGGYFNRAAPSSTSPSTLFTRTSYFVPYIAPLSEQVTINAFGCSFINSSNGQVTSSYTLNNQYEDVHLIFDTEVNAWLIVYGSNFIGPTGPTGAASSVTGPTGVQGPTGPQGLGALGYYGVFHSVLDQSSNNVANAYPMILEITDESNGISMANDASGNKTRITIGTTGTYNLQFSAQLYNQGGGGSGNTIDIWLRKNGIDVPDTNTKVTVQSNNPYVVAAWNFVGSYNSSDYLQLMWSTDNISIILNYDPSSAAVPSVSPAHPVVPSVIVTVSQVVYVGPTGAASSVTGPTGQLGPIGPTGLQGGNGTGGGLVLYMNYAQNISPTGPILTAGQLTTITGQSMQNPTNVTYNPNGGIPATPPVPPGSTVSALSLTPNLALAQQTITFTTPNNNTTDVPVTQFAIYKSSLNLDYDYIPPGIMEMNIYAKADSINDKDNIGLRFYLLGRRITDASYVNLVANGSDLVYLYDSTSSQLMTLDLLIGSVISLTPYDLLQVVVTSRNRNNNPHTAEIYFQSSNTYSHMHTTFALPGMTGPTGAASSVTGPTGPSQNLAQTLAIGNNAGPTGINMNSQNISEISNIIGSSSVGVDLNITSANNITMSADNIDFSSNGRLIIPTLAGGKYLDYNPVTAKLTLASNSTGGGGNPMISLLQNDPSAGAASFLFYKNSSTPTVGIGELTFQAKDAGGTQREYGRINATIRNTGSGNQDGSFSFQALVNNALTECMRINGADSQVEVLQPLDMNNNGITNSLAGGLTISSGTGLLTLTGGSTNTNGTKITTSAATTGFIELNGTSTGNGGVYISTTSGGSLFLAANGGSGTGNIFISQSGTLNSTRMQLGGLTNASWDNVIAPSPSFSKFGCFSYAGHRMRALGYSTSDQTNTSFGLTGPYFGRATLVAGTVTVTNTTIGANDLIFLTPIGSTNEGLLSVTITPGASFTILSSNVADIRTVNYMVVINTI